VAPAATPRGRLGEGRGAGVAAPCAVSSVIERKISPVFRSRWSSRGRAPDLSRAAALPCGPFPPRRHAGAVRVGRGRAVRSAP
jgi:hypothetical protein